MGTAGGAVGAAAGAMGSAGGAAGVAGGPGRGPGARQLIGYASVAITLIALYPVLPDLWRGIALVVVCGSSAGCVLAGRRRVRRAWRWPWTLLASALLVFVLANLVLRLADPSLSALGWLIDALGNLLVLAAALSLIVRRGARDLGGLVDAAVMALAAGSLLWALLPHRFGVDKGAVAQGDLFVVVFALTGVLGAVTRMLFGPTRVRALWWVLASITLAIGGNVVEALGGGTPVAEQVAGMLFMGAFTAIGLFGLDRSGPRLVSPGEVADTERLSVARLVFLGAAVAAVPAIVGLRDLAGFSSGGLELAVQEALVAVLVMLRIGLLAAERNRAEQALQHQATHDQLTGLANRRQFVAVLRDELAHDARCVVLFCDLDGFKAVNDRHGHDTGDELLVQVARRLEQTVQPPAVVSRFGGDEFVILLADASEADARQTRDRIEATLAEPFDELRDVRIGASIGLTPANGERDPEELLRVADRTMYAEKASHHRADR